MSRFLGPIHYTVFNKIKAFEELESCLIEQLKVSYDTELSTLVTQVYKEYGAPLEDESLENLIDTDNIHGWLQNRIDIAETRHAAILSNVLTVYGEKAFYIMKGCYEEQGTRLGIDARETKNVSTAPALYQGINNYLLDGMPCDQVNKIIVNQEDCFQWKVTECLHEKFWDNNHADINHFYQLREAWVTHFVSNANPQFTYRFEQKNIDGIPTLIHKITK